MNNIDEKIEERSEEDKAKFRANLINVLYSIGWCRSHGLDYDDPNIQKAKEELYKDMYLVK